MVFEDIAGQDKVKRTLLDIAESGRIGHAYLFVGPEGIGRKSIAKVCPAGYVHGRNNK